MKRLRKSTFLKGTVSFLLFLSIIVTAVLGYALLAVYLEDGLYDGGIDIMRNVGKEICYYHAAAIASYYRSELVGESYEITDKAFLSKYSKWNTNIRYEVIGIDEGLVSSTMDASNIFVSSVYTETASKYTEGETVTKHFMTDQAAYDYYNELEANSIVMSFNVQFDDQYPNFPYKMTAVLGEVSRQDFSVITYLPSQLKPIDASYFIFGAVGLVSQYFYLLLGVFAVLVLFDLLMISYIITSSGRRVKTDEIKLGFFARMPFDLYLLIVAFIFLGFYWLIMDIDHLVIPVAILTLVMLGVCIGILFSVSARLKVKGWYRNSIIFILLKWVFRFIFKLIRKIVTVLSKINLYWKTAIYTFIFCLTCLIASAIGHEGGALLIILSFIVNAAVLVKFILDLRRLEHCADEIAGGNIRNKISEATLLPSLRKHARSLNGIGGGLESALDMSLKNERTKSELITNVSHDIKTPLTSIVNYVGLMRKEGLDSENAPEYLEVLERQSLRLKKLTEDLVEASKAASGTVSVNAENTDINIVVSQAVGEYRDILIENGTTPVLTIPDEECIVFADGRLLWRIFDNLLCNIKKYAMKNTRVYISSERIGGNVTVTFKNISAEPLNISSDELTERFVRGDSSRNTEGSGLGLSIAKSLAELQGGALDIDIDGDLFKATVTFPYIK